MVCQMCRLDTAQASCFANKRLLPPNPETCIVWLYLLPGLHGEAYEQTS